MGKNGSRVISFSRYRAVDLFVFAMILLVSEVLSYYAFAKWFADYSGRYIFSFVTPITLLVMIRWGWYGIFYSVVDGLFYAMLFLVNVDGVSGELVLQYLLIFGIGNAFIGLVYPLVHFVGYKKLMGRWIWAVLFSIAGWACIVVGRIIVALCCGISFSTALTNFFNCDLLSMAMCVVIMLVMRRLDGMTEYQKDYLLRLKREREEKLRIDTYGDEPIEITPEDIQALNKKGDDLFGK